MRGVLMLAVFVACYSPSLPAGAPCGNDSNCPSDQRCIAGVCSTGDTPPPDAGASCVSTADPQIPDEDGDHLPDSCDPCPLVAGNATTDSDGDGIPDACDPDLTAASGHMRDTTWLFDGLRSQPAWAAVPVWTPTSDHNALQVAAPGGGAAADSEGVLPLVRPGRVFDHFRVSASVRVTAINGTAGSLIGLRVFDDERSTNNLADTVDCGLWQDPSNFGGTRSFSLGDDDLLDQGSAFAWKTSTDYTIVMERDGGRYNCQVISSTGAGDPPQASGPSPITPHTGAAIKLVAFGITATVNWVYVIGSP